ncbi:DUF2267 domain-containing protein [Limnochorda pilosa]|uniref:DUF2267 domain-containing protein n=1 Tax=Limnochorda pilosa TaxID=1555112 RepID=UPI0009EAD061
MRHDESIGHVQDRAGLSSRGEAERATQATLQTLAERLAGGAAENLASQLPPQIHSYTLGRTAGPLSSIRAARATRTWSGLTDQRPVPPAGRGRTPAGGGAPPCSPRAT